GSVTSSRAMSRPRVVLQVGESAASALGRLYANVVPGAPVVDSAGAFVGTVTSARLSEAASSGAPGTRIDPCIDPTAAGVQSSAALDVALEALTTTPDSFVSVLDSSQHVVGIITVSAIVKGYQGALGANLSRLSSIARGAEPIEVRVGEASPVAGRRLKDARLPTGTVVVTLEGPGGLVFPDGETFIATGDVLSAVVPAEAAAKLRQLLAAVEDREEPLL
ncbi:MAG: TrkA C-terminal domain-containing protein, partial [Acidimicrobiales bacterium]